MSDRLAARVCVQTVRGHLQQPRRRLCRLLKRYVCAASALPLVKAGADSLGSWPPGGACPNLSDHQTLRVCAAKSFEPVVSGVVVRFLRTP